MTGLKPGYVNLVIGDAHIYSDHIEAVKTQLERKPYEPPKLIVKNRYDNIDYYKTSDFEIVDYKFHPTIKAKMIA
jgi:thymidylate synthase